MAAPAACLARRPVSKRITRLPKRPLSMTASENWISGPSIESHLRFLFHGVQPHQPSPASVYWPALHPVIDRDPRAKASVLEAVPGDHYRGPRMRDAVDPPVEFFLKKAAPFRYGGGRPLKLTSGAGRGAR